MSGKPKAKRARRATKARPPASTVAPFALSMLGGAVERRYRHQRPNVEKIRWGTLDTSKIPDDLLRSAREFWTRNAHNEYYSAACVAQVVQSLIAAQAPLDLIAFASGFIADELTHAEMASRVVAELGDSVPLIYESAPPIPIPDPALTPLMQAACYVLDAFCIGESLALPLSQASARWPAPPMIAQVLQRISKDESAHGSFGWIFMDWAGEMLSDEDRAYLARLARIRVEEVRGMFVGDPNETAEPTLGWLPAVELRRVALELIETDVVEPLRARGLYV